MMPPTPSTGRRRWFAAEERLLALDTPEDYADSPLSDLHDAVLLAAQDSLLSALAECCGREFDWRPVSAPSELDLTHSVSDAQGSGNQAGLSWPTALSICLRERATACTARITICEHTVDAQVRLDELTLSPIERSKLAPGSVLFLPTSYAEYWRLVLELPREINSSINVLAQPATGLLFFDSWNARASAQSVPNQTEGHSCRVYLDTHVTLDLNDWLDSARNDGTSVTTPAFFNATVHIELGNDQPDRMKGRLFPVGDGYAVRIDCDT